MSNIKKELIDFKTHCFETGQLQVGELMSTAIMHIAELKEQVEAAMTFNVDVIRCLSRIASVENHNEVPAYIDMSRRCIKTIEAKQAKALKERE
jgi:hypothetical protein